MNFVVIKTNNKISILINNKKINYKHQHCILLGNIYNLDELYDFNDNINNSDKVLILYDKYKEKLFYKLNGEYIIVLIKDDNIIIVRDRMGSKQVYYSYINDAFICSNTLDYFIKNYKEIIHIDKQQVANYLNYLYIQEPYTIFKNIYKMKAGHYITYNRKIKEKKYYNLVKEYRKLNKKSNDFQESKKILEENLLKSIHNRIVNHKKIGIYLSSGIDSVLIASLTKKINKKIYTYTIGFYNSERNEATQAKEISKYLKTNHKEFYLSKDIGKNIVYELPKIYTEPFADPSIIPTVYLNKMVGNDADIILTGDGADQLFCGSSVYDNFKVLNRKLHNLVNYKILKKSSPKKILCSYTYNKNEQKEFYDIPSQSYYNLPFTMFQHQVKYMLFDLKSFLANRLLTKVSLAANYNNINIAHPYIDNEFITSAFRTKHKFKYYQKEKKYILKKILCDNIPQELINSKKTGFGIDIKKWIYDIFKDDIIKYSEPEVLIKQNIFSVDRIENKINKLKSGTLTRAESNIFFAYYIFQLWYQYHIEDLWKK